jgi:hypothetical protein
VITAFIRYSWTSWQAARELLHDDEWLIEIQALMAERTTLSVGQASPGTWRGRELQTVLRWFQDPRLNTVPGRKTLRLARQQAEPQQPDILSQVHWVERTADHLASASNFRMSTQELYLWLRRICASDFPTLLLWHDTRVALRIFNVAPEGIVVPRCEADDRRGVRQAVRVCVNHLLGSLGRFGPRGAWIGVAFAKEQDAAACEEIPIRRCDESLLIEPDLSWFARHWPQLKRSAISAGMPAWTVLEEACLRSRAGSKLARLNAIVSRLQREVEKLNGQAAMDFSRARDFIVTTDRWLSRSVGTKVWHADPHCWWISRNVVGELSLPAGFANSIREARRSHRGALLEKAAVARRPRNPSQNIPYPLQLRTKDARDVVLEAEEFYDWIVKGNACRSTPPWVPERISGDLGWIVRQLPSGLSFLATDPNPRRAADLHAIRQSHRPNFCRSLEGRLLKPPAGLFDNRLLRLHDQEAPSHTSAQQTFFLSPYLTTSTQPLIDAEVAGPLYARAPDIVPRILSRETRSATLGEIDEASGIWILCAESIQRVRQMSTSSLIAHYFVEVHPALGSADWLEVLIDRKRSCFPALSVLAWKCVAHNISASQGGAVSFTSLRASTGKTFVRNSAGEILPAEWIVRGL